MEKFVLQTLIECRDAYCAVTGAAAATVGKNAAGDWRFFDNFQCADPKTTTLRKFDAVMTWFSAHWPEDHCRPVELRAWEAVKDQREIPEQAWLALAAANDNTKSSKRDAA